MMMRYFLGLQLPPPLDAAIVAFRQEWGAAGMQPHITIKAPCGLPSGPDWLETARTICQTHAAIDVHVSGISTFHPSTVYLQVKSPALVSLHLRLLQGLGISAADQKMCFEGALYIPHATLAQLPLTTTAPPLATLAAAAAARFPEPVVFRANQVLVYCKTPTSLYAPVAQLPLGG